MARRGFTRVDLLAAMTVASLAIALVPMASLRARAAARGSHCADNLRRVAAAIQRYETANDGELIRNLYGPQLAGPGDHTAHGGLTLLLPYLDHADLFNRYNFSVHFTDPANQDVTATEVPEFRCPEAPPGRLSPAGNAALNPSWRGALSDYASIRGFIFPIGPPHDPTGLGAFEQRLLRPEEAQVRVYRSMITDGASQTIGHIERAGLPGVWQKGKHLDDDRGLNTPVGDEPRGPWSGYSCMNVATYGDDGAISRPAGRCTINCRNVVGQFNDGGPYGFHQGGVHASFIDGSVRFLREGMSPYVLFALGSRAGGEVVSAEDF